MNYKIEKALKILGMRKKVKIFVVYVLWDFVCRKHIKYISSDNRCKDGNDQFTIVPFIALSHQVWIKYQCL